MPLDLSASSIDLTRQLVDIESVSGDERRIADEIEQAMRRMPHLEVTRDADLVVARTDLGRARRVVIAGHIDTVPVNRNLPSRFETEAGVDYLWGRGTVDMKAGVAVQLKLAAELADPAVDITWLWYDHEEVTSDLNGLARLARTRPELLSGDFAILGEPSDGAVEGGCNGTMRFDVVTRGRRAHSARAWLGENAIHQAAPVLELLAAYEPETVEVEGLAYRESLNAVLIGGGVAGNVIPDECVVHVNYRFAPSSSGEQAEAKMRALFEPLGEVRVVDVAPGARPGLDDPLARQFVAAVGAEAKPKYGWTDVARFSALGIPAVNFGPGDPGLAHTDDERVPLAQITACESALRTWLA
ncbi:succinyl-diaminopimelate desuccinylase [Gryllotalpicola ginsengisoli]|uniref:succinyl-diaminopimelate desuccinylase n=1 Tax=Gryllotalpicola ginsengisoli TaxID=444608 RepID=UPI0003B6CC35|nr:succinyl-diaminopimelate desuccinylase [Gryllotalpicola ginsengisoli]